MRKVFWGFKFCGYTKAQNLKLWKFKHVQQLAKEKLNCCAVNISTSFQRKRAQPLHFSCKISKYFPALFNSHGIFVIRVPWLHYGHKSFTICKFAYLLVNVVSTYADCFPVSYACLSFVAISAHFISFLWFNNCGWQLPWKFNHLKISPMK